MNRQQAFDAINGERDRQISKWGDQSHTNAFWLVILAEEFGEVAKALYERDSEEMVKELIQVCAVAVAWIEDETKEFTETLSGTGDTGRALPDQLSLL